MKMNCTKIFVSLCLLFLIPLTTIAQKKNQSYVDYVDKYKVLAVSHMKQYKIPASITLAQGLLESGAGMSQFVQKSNNHFGIKCHKEWTGDKVYHDDDNPNDCFRKYKKAEESYEDHSRFLAEKPRYAKLFQLESKDYKGWAKGLQECGYATDKAYANKLIKLIEDYGLYEYDDMRVQKVKTPSGSSGATKGSRKDRPVYKTHGLIYVLANDNDNFDAIAYDLDFEVKDLIKYNEVPENFPLCKGDIVYLEKKKKKADKPYYEHIVQIGESMHSISQKYGLRMDKLYKMNEVNEEYVPEEGDVLRLR